MKTTELKFTSDGHELAGTLLIPPGAPSATALLISGSGPIDRDSNMKRMRIDVMRQIAEHLARAGIASYRYDKRGVADSTGDYRATGFHDNVADAQAALEALRARPEIDADRIVAIGHSEGALIATELAAADVGLAGAVLLAGAAQPGEQILRWQATQVAGSLPKPARLILKLLRKDLLKMQDKRLAQLKESSDDVIRIQLVRINARWFREFMAHDPTIGLARAKTPILAITGAKDLQVDPGDIAIMESLAPADFTGEVVPDVTHLLRRETGPASLRTYKKQVRRPVDRRLLETISSWVTNVVGRATDQELTGNSL